MVGSTAAYWLARRFAAGRQFMVLPSFGGGAIAAGPDTTLTPPRAQHPAKSSKTEKERSLNEGVLQGRVMPRNKSFRT